MTHHNEAGTVLTCSNPDCGCRLRIEEPCPHGDSYTCACGHALEALEAGPVLVRGIGGFAFTAEKRSQNDPMEATVRKTLISLAGAALVVAGGALPASAGGKGTVTEEWQVTAAPFPGADDHSDPATECGIEGVNFAIHSFETPGRGRLDASITDFQGEWDLYLTDSSGSVLASSVNFMAGSEERLTASLPARTEVHIYACNFAGGPIANGQLKYVYRK